MIKFEDFDFDNILIDEKPYQNILIYDIWYRTLTVAKLVHIKFDKVDEFVRFYDRTRHLVLFSPEKYDTIYNSIRYLISQKSGITYDISYNYAKIKADWYDSLPLEKKNDFA